MGLISRQAAIEALGEAHFKGYGDAIIVIQDLPAAQQWIPASQKPEKSDQYLLTMKRIDIDEEPFYSIEWYDADQQAFGKWLYPMDEGERTFEDFSDYFEIYGWMPLPEMLNYKGVE